MSKSPKERKIFIDGDTKSWESIWNEDEWQVKYKHFDYDYIKKELNGKFYIHTAKFTNEKSAKTFADMWINNTNFDGNYNEIISVKHYQTKVIRFISRTKKEIHDV